MSKGPGPSQIGVIDGDSIESAPLIRSNTEEQSTTTGGQRQSESEGYGMSGKKYGRKRTRTISVEGTNLSSWFDFSTTTVIGLFLLLAMTALTILSICLQRYSTNKYVDIIVPITNASVNGTSPTGPEVIL